MKRWMNGLFALALALGLGGVALEADAAKRVGGGGSVGMQRNVTPPPAKAPTAAPQQASPAAGAAAPAAAAAGGASRWLGPIAGIAAGLGLGWLIGQSGMGGMVGSLMLGLLLVFGLVIAFKLLTRNRSQQPAMAGAGAGYGQGNSQYNGLGQETVAAPPPSQPIGGAWGGNTSAAAPAAAVDAVAPRVPAGFDVAGFVKQARLNFNRLQDANDRADLSLLREVCTEEMFASLREQIGTRTTPVAPTEISQLDAQLVEVTTEGQYHWASVSFSGLSSEEPGQPAQPFHEVWNLRKSVSGDTGWLLAGIQQVS
jgi:predicted lipid-binding transport protein (Tim44 family)